MSIFRPEWDNTLSPALRTYVRGGKLIGAVLQYDWLVEGEYRIRYRALTLDWKNRATDYKEETFDILEAAIAHVENTVGDRDSVAERIAGYAYRYWMRHHMERWPTVAEAANSLKIRRREIDECCGDGLYQLTGYNTGQDNNIGHLYVEAMTDDVEAAWCKYWLAFSAGCICGQHHNAVTTG